jgi:pyroglutamyl-peptidase
MIFLTGFEPFTTGQGLVLDHNPTADIAKRVADCIDGADFAVLPVSFQQTKQRLLSHFEQLKPEIWIGLGFAPHRNTLDIETVALNLEHTVAEDNDGEAPWMRPIHDDAPLAYRTRLDEQSAIETFAAHGITASAAVHAGTFLCNQSFFVGCHYAEQQTPLKLAAFIHVPPMKSFGPFENALAELIRSLIEGRGSLASTHNYT